MYKKKSSTLKSALSFLLTVMPMNGQAADQNGRKRRDVDNVKLSTIRIWMHEKDIGKLTRVLWAGQGNRLCQQASNNARVKRFLGAVPQVMNAIKELHQAVIDNNLETLQVKLEPPVPPALVTSKDANGLNIIHKAAGLGHTKILEYLVGIWPEGAHETDVTGKTALHWAASAKNNMRCYTLLTKAGCDEEVLDYKMKTPSYYRHKPHEIERAFLVYVPEAPRVSPSSVTDWEALSDDNDASSSSGDVKKLDIKIPAHVNGINERALEDSIENTSELDTNDGTSDDLSKTEATAHELDTPEAPEDVGIESENENIARAVSADKTNEEALSETANVDNEEAAENVGNGFDNEAHVLEQEQTAEELLNDEMPIELEEEQNGDMTNEMQEQNGDMANEVEASVTEKTEAEFEQVIEEQEAAIESAKDEIVEHETAVEQAETEEITANGEPELSEPEQEVDEEQEEVQIEDTAATDETQKAAANKQVDVDEEEDDDEVQFGTL